MTDTLLVSEAKVRSYTGLNNSVDSNLIRNSIRIAGDYRLQAIIGTLLYERLINDVKAGTLSGNYKNLLDNYIQDFLIYASYYEIIEEIYLRSRNNGLLRPNGGENSDPVDKDLYLMKRQSVDNKMTYYAERLTNYIVEENGLFPELDQADKLYEQDPDYTGKYKNPFVMKTYPRLEYMKRMGLPVYDRRYRQYPQGMGYSNDSTPE